MLFRDRPNPSLMAQFQWSRRDTTWTAQEVHDTATFKQFSDSSNVIVNLRIEGSAMFLHIFFFFVNLKARSV